MTGERTGEEMDGTKTRGVEADIDRRKDEPIEEAEKDLSRYSTSDSRPPLAEQERTSAETNAQEAARESKALREAEREPGPEGLE
jgi:hypothetical protein